MIEELVIVDDMSDLGLYKRYRETYVTTLLPEPAMNSNSIITYKTYRERERTFSMDPE